MKEWEMKVAEGNSSPKMVPADQTTETSALMGVEPGELSRLPNRGRGNETKVPRAQQ